MPPPYMSPRYQRLEYMLGKKKRKFPPVGIGYSPTEKAWMDFYYESELIKKREETDLWCGYVIGEYNNKAGDSVKK